MKKVLIGIAAAAMAVVGTGAGSASALPTDTIYDELIGGVYGWNADFLDAAGWDDKFGDCGGPYYTVFAPAYGVLDGLATVLGYVDAEAALELAPDIVKGLLAYHVVAGYYSGVDLVNGLFSSLTNSVGGTLTISNGDAVDEFDVDGIGVDINGPGVGSVTTCNGIVHYLAAPGILKPSTSTTAPSCGANIVGGCPAGSTTSSGSGLPKTGSESMALTYAALASLIAGAGVLVIRRRSIA